MLNRRTLLGAVGASPLIPYAGTAWAATPRDVLVMARQIDDIVSLDPQESFEFAGQEVLANVYDRLILPDLKDPTVIKGDLAESWSTSEDGLTTTFKMAQGRKFASGNPVTAEDAAMRLAYAQRVIIVPGYGMAVAQSQHQVRELADLIERKGGEG